jgi:hypothetical protein
MYFSYPVAVNAFQVTLTYQDVDGGGADGFAFVVQNDPRGTSAVGGSGGSLGYEGVTPSVAACFSIYGDTFAFRTDGAAPSPDQSPAPVSLNTGGDPIAVTLLYTNGTLTLTLVDTITSDTFTSSEDIDIPGTVGSTNAYVGFSAACGGISSWQHISDFNFISLAPPPTPATQPVLTIQPVVAGQNITFTWSADSGSGYQLQQTPSLTAPITWTTVTNIPTTVNGTNQVILSPTTNQTMFYRLISQ